MSQYRTILQQYWGYADFRPLQHDIISSIGSGKDTLGLMPTGGGKSLCMDHYPLPDGGGVIKEAFLHDLLVLSHATKKYNERDNRKNISRRWNI